MKKVWRLLGVMMLVGVACYIWHVHFNYRFEEISKGKVYKSGLIPPDRLESFLLNNEIKTVIDLLNARIQDSLNPAKQTEIDAEDKAISKINRDNNLHIKHISIASSQIPTTESLEKFFQVLDKGENYPVLIHCYHGTGRAAMYSALYRIEYEKWSNYDARMKTRIIVEGLGYRSSFARGKEKGDFLINYHARLKD